MDSGNVAFMCDESAWVTVLSTLGGVVVGGLASYWTARDSFERERRHRLSEVLIETYAAWRVCLAKELKAHVERGESAADELALLESKLELLESDKRAWALMRKVRDTFPRRGETAWSLVQKFNGEWGEFDAALTELTEYLKERERRPVPPWYETAS